jgi:hypothetical protein
MQFKSAGINKKLQERLKTAEEQYASASKQLAATTTRAQDLEARLLDANTRETQARHLAAEVGRWPCI